MSFDINSIVANITIGLVGGSATWLLSNITRMRKDINGAFKKIRQLEEKTNGKHVFENLDGTGGETGYREIRIKNDSDKP